MEECFEQGNFVLSAEKIACGFDEGSVVLFICLFFNFWFMVLDQGYGIEGFGSISPLQSMYNSANSAKEWELRRVGFSVVRVVREISMVLPADG